MDTSLLLQTADFDGVQLDLTPEGKLHYSGDPALIAEWLPILRERKAEIVAELRKAKRHAQVAAMLEGSKYAVMVEDAATDPVIATVGIRGIATFEMAIPKHSYDGMVLLQLLENYATETPPEPSQSSGDAAPSPNSNEARLDHPDRRTA